MEERGRKRIALPETYKLLRSLQIGPTLRTLARPSLPGNELKFFPAKRVRRADVPDGGQRATANVAEGSDWGDHSRGDLHDFRAAGGSTWAKEELDAVPGCCNNWVQEFIDDSLQYRKQRELMQKKALRSLGAELEEAATMSTCPRCYYNVLEQLQPVEILLLDSASRAIPVQIPVYRCVCRKLFMIFIVLIVIKC